MKGGPEALLIKWLCSIVNSPLAFLYVLLPVIGLECFSSMQRGSAVVATLPIKRKDVLQSLYLVALISATTSAAIAAAINTIITYSTSGLALDLRYYYVMFLTYIVAFIPTMLFVTSLGMVLYSITPLKSEVPVLISVVYLMIVPLLRILAILATGGEESGTVLAAIFSPSYGFLEFLRYLVGGVIQYSQALACLVASAASLVTMTAMAVVLFSEYAEVSL